MPAVTNRISIVGVQKTTVAVYVEIEANTAGLNPGSTTPVQDVTPTTNSVALPCEGTVVKLQLPSVAAIEFGVTRTSTGTQLGLVLIEVALEKTDPFLPQIGLSCGITCGQ
jgi:hypothetical protein